MSDQDPLPPLVWDSRRVQIQGFTTGLHQLEWLLVTLVTLYVGIMGIPNEGGWGLLLATIAYFGFSLTASRLRFFGDRQRWLLAIHTWVMIGFITWFLYSTEGVTGPMASLYLLAVVTSALTLGVLATLLEVAAIAACYLLLLQLSGATLMTPANLTLVSTNLAVFLIVGYLTAALVTAIQVSNRMLLDMASQDPLTGLFNRRALTDLSQPIHALAKRSQRPYSVIVIDMDGLKAINDSQGHEAGDRAILDLAQRLKSCARSSDLVARHGGDEFVMLLPDTDADGARHLMQRLLASVVDSGLQFSIGVASYPEHGDQMEHLLAHADHAMYRSKTSGGNRVFVQGQAPREHG
ncbi:GGDEF domain-containing protein [Halomonas ramblicola]|uniref:GGDEF domain-containing protein n=1 Tax=Halomonas ramblicola TaxID=747349 RepID=UPI0025B2D0F1|nr:diguanylate cyclase [Halomonas ramblicola]MDN3521932.1 diguanylate cyclase [Halomonas ramblicola]